VGTSQGYPNLTDLARGVCHPCLKTRRIMTGRLHFPAQSAERTNSGGFRGTEREFLRTRARRFPTERSFLTTSCRGVSRCAGGCRGLPFAASAASGGRSVRLPEGRFFTDAKKLGINWFPDFGAFARPLAD